jgi:RNA polymerase sigma-70 factor (ECF subfamily)
VTGKSKEGPARTATAAGRHEGEPGPAQATESPLLILDERELVERAKSDPDAFGLLYERHVRSVFAFALSKVRDVSTAEDVASQTFLKALPALARYEYRGAPFRSWLLRIAANVVADLHRTPHPEVPLLKHPQASDTQEDIEVVDERAGQDIAEWEQAEEFSRLIADLTAEQRRAVALRFVDGLDINSIASRMSRSEGSVKMLLMRALQNLRRNLAMETCDAG